MITMDQIDEFRKRTNSSYSDAKYFLEKNNGDILEAIIDFERTNAGKTQKSQQKKQSGDFGRRFAEVLQKSFDTRICVEDKGSTLFTVPVIFLILMIPLWYLVVLFFIFLLILGYRFSIKDIKNKVNVNLLLQNISEKMKNSGRDGTNKDGTSHTGAAKTQSSVNPVTVTDHDKNHHDNADNGNNDNNGNNGGNGNNDDNDHNDDDNNDNDGYNEYTVE